MQRLCPDLADLLHHKGLKMPSGAASHASSVGLGSHVTHSLWCEVAKKAMRVQELLPAALARSVLDLRSGTMGQVFSAETSASTNGGDTIQSPAALLFSRDERSALQKLTGESIVPEQDVVAAFTHIGIAGRTTVVRLAAHPMKVYLVTRNFCSRMARNGSKGSGHNLRTLMRLATKQMYQLS